MRNSYTQGSDPFKVIFKHMFKHSAIRNKLELIGLRNKYKFDHERLRDIEQVKNTTKKSAKSCSRSRIKTRALSNTNHVLTEMTEYKARSETVCISQQNVLPGGFSVLTS